MQVVDDPAGGQMLKHWTWDGERWSAQEDLRLTSAADIHVTFMDAVGTTDGRLGFSYITERSLASVGQFPYELRYSERTVSMPLIPSTPGVVSLPTAQPTATATAEIMATKQPTLIPTSTPIGEQPEGSSKPLNITVIGLGLGWILVMMLVVGAFVYELRKRKKHKRTDSDL